MVELVRGWLDSASISVPQLHRALTSDHFVSGHVPDLRRLRDLLAGDGLGWDLVEAVADLCFPHGEGVAADTELDRARQLWRQAQDAPTPLDGALGRVVPAEVLLGAQERTIRAYEEMDRARQAYIVSEQGRQQTLQVATVLFAMLGQAQSKIAELRRQVDALQSTALSRPGELGATQQRLARASEQEHELRIELTRAERERDTAQQVADVAARRVHQLEEELTRLKECLSRPHEPDGRAAQANTPVEFGPASGAGDAALDEVDQALRKVRSVLDREHAAIREAADDVGWHEPTGPIRTEGSSPVVPGQVVRHDAPRDDFGVGLSGTTPDNPATSAAIDRRSGDRLRFVGAATRRISRGVDLDEIVLGLCRASVPTFADAILVYLRDPLPVGDERVSGPVVFRLRRTDRLRSTDDHDSFYSPAMPALEAASPKEDTEIVGGDGAPAEFDIHQLPGLGPQGNLPASELCEIRPGGDLARVLRDVRPVFGATADAKGSLSELLGPNLPVPKGQRAMLAPLRGRRRIIGAAVFLRSPGRFSFEQNDLLLAAQLATQTALGIEKATLYNRESYIADELQISMLPASLPQPDGVLLTTRYLPAAETARVGGDWYDAILLQEGKIALVIGDVMGHSIRSAAIMGQLRSTVHALAEFDLSPPEVLRRLDELAQRMGPDCLATCLYVVYDPASERITLASAGHPPPLLVQRSGRVEVLQVPPGAPIGAGVRGFEAVELDAAGATLFMYTDGLVESRLRDVWTGIEQLRQRLSAKVQQTGLDDPTQLEALCDDVLDMLGPGDRDDDIALLAAQFEGKTSD
ncbi:SpoIIE family protein phosphatase [Streptomyces sp. NBC_00040]|uniref:PP2C family protein-serine/threonine phosphatase n=1 Tax=Streptomyces sp. NBC_00040 TaxID=2903616 RepID=UPI00386976A5